MSDAFTPTTDDVRQSYVDREVYVGDDEVRAGTDFDRWLAAHDVGVRAEQREKDAQIAHHYPVLAAAIREGGN